MRKRLIALATPFLFFFSYECVNAQSVDLINAEINITAKKINNGILLDWVVKPETEVSHFSIEKSTDGVNFHKIGESISQNIKSLATYSYLDDHLVLINFYRIKIIDSAGKYSYTKAITLNQRGSWYSAIQPNPFVQSFFVQVYLPSSETLKVQLLDMNGGLIRYKSLMGIAGTNDLEFNDIGNLQSGVYLVRIIRTEAVIEQKIIKANL